MPGSTAEACTAQPRTLSLTQTLTLALALTLTRRGQQMPREEAETVRIQLAAVTAAVAVHCQHSDAADEAHQP